MKVEKLKVIKSLRFASIVFGILGGTAGIVSIVLLLSLSKPAVKTECVLSLVNSCENYQKYSYAEQYSFIKKYPQAKWLVVIGLNVYVLRKPTQIAHANLNFKGITYKENSCWKELPYFIQKHFAGFKTMEYRNEVLVPEGGSIRTIFFFFVDKDPTNQNAKLSLNDPANNKIGSCIIKGTRWEKVRF